jgi:circadian clock protein KaiC
MKADMRRVRTGIPDLDLILGGGLEPGSLLILAGAPGTGKTILAQQICFANATLEHKALYYTTLSEPHSKLVRHLESFEFFKPAALGKSVDFIHLGELVQEAPNEGLGPIVSEVVRKSFETRPAVVVIDSAKALRDFVSEHQLRTALYGLASRVAHTDALLLLVGEYRPREIEGGVEGLERPSHARVTSN